MSALLAFLAAHADIIEAVVELIDSGASKDSIKAALRAVKVKISDEAMREELGLDEGGL